MIALGNSVLIVLCLTLLISSCTQEEPTPWEGSKLSQSRNQLTVEELQQNRFLPLADMSYFAKPEWAGEAVHSFSGSISFADIRLLFDLWMNMILKLTILSKVWRNKSFPAHEGRCSGLLYPMTLLRHDRQ